MLFPDKLRILRMKAGLSQAQLGQRLNVSAEDISRWETGESAPTMEDMLPLARLLGVSVDYLLDKDASDPSKEEEESTWDKIKAWLRRYGFWGGYILAVIGGIRLLKLLLVGISAGLAVSGIADLLWSAAVGFGGAVGLVFWGTFIFQALVSLAMLVGGLWLAHWLKKKYRS